MCIYYGAFVIRLGTGFGRIALEVFVRLDKYQKTFQNECRIKSAKR